MEEKVNILAEADRIVNGRSDEKTRAYGDFPTSMERAAMMASLMTGKAISAQDMYLCMVAVKLSREAHCHKADNLLDAAAYLGALENHHQLSACEQFDVIAGLTEPKAGDHFSSTPTSNAA